LEFSELVTNIENIIPLEGESLGKIPLINRDITISAVDLIYKIVQ
jgi:hypothetical protein